MGQWHWFQFVSTGIMALFFGILIYVVTIAYMRPSGSTGMDVATIQKTRYEALSQNKPSSLPHIVP